MSKEKTTLQAQITLSDTTMDGASFAPFLFGNAAGEDTKAYDAHALEAASLLGARALLAQKPGMSVVEIDSHTIKRGVQTVSVITLINDNKPFLLDSVMACLGNLVSTIYLLAHPIFDISGTKGGLTVTREKLNKPGENARRVSMMQIHVTPLDEEQEKAVKQELLNVLTQVDNAVRDWPAMLDETQKLMDVFSKPIIGVKASDAQNVVAFLSWLKDHNFIFLGLRHYDFHKGKKAAEAFEPRGLALGILSDESVRVLRDANADGVPDEILSFMESDAPLIVTKSTTRSSVHHNIWLDYIGIKLYDDQGRANGEVRLVGLFTKIAYTHSVMRIPYLKEKAEAVINQLGFDMTDYSGKELLSILEKYPRDDMFRIDEKTLRHHICLILELSERPRVRALSHNDPFGRFVSLLIFVPRDRYDSTIRNNIGTWLTEIYQGDFFEFHPLFLDNGLTRIHYVVHRKSADATPQINRNVLEENIAHIISNWEDRVLELAGKTQDTPTDIALAVALPQAYHDLFTPQDALFDARSILSLSASTPIKVVFYKNTQNGAHTVSLKLFHYGSALMLSERVPLLENMGFKVLLEKTLKLPNGKGDEVYLHDMQLENAYQQDVDLSDGGTRLADTFNAIWAGDAHDDGFNALTQTAKLDWRQIVILRAYGRYLQQAGIPYAQNRLAETLNRTSAITRNLYALFALKFDPQSKTKDSEQAEKRLQEEIETELRAVPSLDDDLIIRRFRNLIAASLRTNAFAPEKDGAPRRTLAIKLDPQAIEGLPDPKPYREIFVFGPDVEGVHLRMSAVARGGIRWSDRALDYRTEVLSLVKAQQVKNAVIVPGGAKGGFYPLNLPVSPDRAIVAEGARQAYITYISAMLSITDNIVGGKVTPPQNVVRHDGDDPYFVVAADKGTATFSDTANALSTENHFWLDDAFASGGSAGYDHKGMGITAKGAWEAVKRHFRELFDRDIQKEPFSCVGVGDMSGDVFGNGMLLSKQTQLIAAFDHRDIFIDPTPDTAASYAERLRLFKTPRSSWQDYDRQTLSKGGEVYSRSLKTITLSPEAAKAIGFDKKTGTPFEIIMAILKADVDLLWFGGIGTYIRSSLENDMQVGDRANDVIRIAGCDVRAKIIGEGANLGMTQRGRIEYSMAGGRCDTDAIDNSAGVNCSDMEVNIKIALSSAMQKGKLTREERNKLLKAMTADVSGLVLRNNYLQPLTLSLAEARGAQDLPYQMRFMGDLERANLLNRKVEILPDDPVLNERLKQGQGLTRPELAVVMAYAKLTLQDELTKGVLVDESYFEKTLFNYFPEMMREKYQEEIKTHRLHRDIVATVLANDVVNRGGPTFVARLQDKTGKSFENVIQAYVAVRDGFHIPALYEALNALDNKIPGRAQNTLYRAVMTMLFKTVGWMLRNVDMAMPLEKLVAFIRDAHNSVGTKMETLMPDDLKALLTERANDFAALGAPKALAAQLADLSIASIIPDIALVAQKAKSDIAQTAKIYFALAELFHLGKIEEASRTIPVVDYYDGIVLSEANERIASALRAIALYVIKINGESKDPVGAWLEERGSEATKTIARMNALIEGDLNISRFTVAASMMAQLAH